MVAWFAGPRGALDATGRASRNKPLASCFYIPGSIGTTGFSNFDGFDKSLKHRRLREPAPGESVLTIVRCAS